MKKLQKAATIPVLAALLLAQGVELPAMDQQTRTEASEIIKAVLAEAPAEE